MLKKKGLQQLVQRCYLTSGLQTTVEMLDALKHMGFTYATRSGMSIGIEDLIIPQSKAELSEKARDEVIKVEQQYLEGAITNGERYNKVIAVWSDVTEKIADAMFKEMERRDESGQFNPVFIMADSGARGSKQQIRQLAGMRGLMAKPSGEIIETPIKANFREGLSVLEYFISTHGARKGLADTALKTADSGYLTRRLVDVAQDVIVSDRDCGTLDGIEARAIVESGEIIEPLRDRIIGRVVARADHRPAVGQRAARPQRRDRRGEGGRGPGRGHREGQDPLGADLRVTPRRVRQVLRPRPGDRQAGRDGSGGRRRRRAVDRRARHAADDAHVPHRRHGVAHLGCSRRSTRSTRASSSSTTCRWSSGRSAQGGNELIVMNRNGHLVIQDDKGRDRERYQIPYGARLQGQGRPAGRERPDPGRVGSVHVLDPHRGNRSDPLQGHHRGPHGPRGPRRGHRVCRG